MARGAAALLVLLAAAPAWAHDEKLSLSRLEVADDGLVWTVDIALQGLQKVLELPADPIDLTERQLQAAKPEIVRYLRTCMKVALNGAGVEPDAGALEPVYDTFVASGEKYIAHARQEFRFRSAAPVKRATVSGAFFATKTSQHQAVLAVRWAGAQRTFTRVGAFDLDLTPSLVRSGLADFFVWGLRALLFGADHVAFLLALLLGTRKLSQAAQMLASFGAAGTITLILAGTGKIQLPAVVAGSLIAASVVYVAAENLFVTDARHRWVLAFAFGLAHGLGFWWALRDRLQDADSRALPIAATGTGMVLGQLAVLLVAWPILSLLRKAPDEETAARRARLLARIGSVPVVAVGAALLADRLFQRGWFS